MNATAMVFSVILRDGTQTYIYGTERLFSHARNGVETWYAHDGLGSVRQTLNATGMPQASVSDDPWGTPDQAMIAPFGFTGAWQQGSQVYLRARWYNSQHGIFTSRDPFQGMEERPYSQHPYEYAYSAPTTWTDPSGKYVLEVRYNKIGSVLNKDFHHAYIVVTDQDGSQYYWRGGPSNSVSPLFISLASGGSSSQSSSGSSDQSSGSSDQSSGSNSGSSCNPSNSTSPGSGPGGAGQNTGPWGALTTKYGRYTSATVDWNTNPAATVLIFKNNKPFDKFQELNNSMDRIKNLYIPYNLISTNSNATAHQGVEDIGLPRPYAPVWSHGNNVRLWYLK